MYCSIGKLRLISPEWVPAAKIVRTFSFIYRTSSTSDIVKLSLSLMTGTQDNVAWTPFWIDWKGSLFWCLSFFASWKNQLLTLLNLYTVHMFVNSLICPHIFIFSFIILGRGVLFVFYILDCVASWISMRKMGRHNIRHFCLGSYNAMKFFLLSHFFLAIKCRGPSRLHWIPRGCRRWKCHTADGVIIPESLVTVIKGKTNFYCVKSLRLQVFLDLAL